MTPSSRLELEQARIILEDACGLLAELESATAMSRRRILTGILRIVRENLDRALAAVRRVLEVEP